MPFAFEALGVLPGERIRRAMGRGRRPVSVHLPVPVSSGLQGRWGKWIAQDLFGRQNPRVWSLMVPGEREMGEVKDGAQGETRTMCGARGTGRATIGGGRASV